MILFWFLAVVLVGTALSVIMAPKPAYSVVALLGHFVALAVLYLSLSAEFIAVTQILVYSGAILMLFLFVMALLSSGNGSIALGPDRLPKISTPALFALALTLIAIGYGGAHLSRGAGAFRQVVPPLAGTGGALPVGAAGAFGSVADFGATLFTVQLLPFELTALLLMVAIIGVVVLAGDHEALSAEPRGLAGLRRLEREAILREGEPLQ